jgi:L-seryl-tRNA(Ser) seleniumtransferase
MDLVTGKRGARLAYAERLITVLTGAERATVVNNNAAALLITLRALCAGREVIVSRGELIEIGGEFRIPEIVEESGVRLVEVGTTNRTHLSDYERAIGPNTAAILKVHTSNYKVVGFTAEVDSSALAKLAGEHELALLHDLGSGLLVRPDQWMRSAEPTVAEALEAGADVVTFSGDKLLGGPQSGIAAGGRDLIERIESHPLMRAVRIGKLTLKAIETTLESYVNGSWRDLPLWQMALAEATHIKERVEALAGRLASRVADDITLARIESHGLAGGGSLPGVALESWAVAISSSTRTPDEIRRRLLVGDPPVVARIDREHVLVDLRSVPQEDEPDLDAALIAALS